MADAAISFAVEKLGDALINKVTFLKGIEDKVRWLKDELGSMQCFLKDADEKQGQDERIRKWISDVREVAQDAENVIEIFTLKVDAQTRKRDLVRKWAGFPTHLSHLNMVGEEIESIRTRLDEIGKRQERYGIRNLGEVGMESSSTRRWEMVEWQRRMASRFQKDKDVVGLNEDADLLLDKVILDEERKGLSLGLIVGMGGIGKSTLARKIYNHPAISARFNHRAWVVVSNEFELEDIMKQIMHELSVPLDADELKTLKSIQGKLRRQEMLQEIQRKRLAGKRYFIVLDDVWEDTHWEVLKNAFPDEQGKASRVLFTSRKEIFTNSQGYIHKVRVLNPYESWELLLKKAVIGGRCAQELEDIGRKILEKCHGLPLAITVAGGLLKSRGDSKSGWEAVLKQMKSYHSETSEISKSVSPILELSYHNLPSHIKPCFLCLAFFKEDAIIQAKRLMRIWIALGFVQTQKGGEETVEERASCYLDELINRNLVQVKEMTIDDRVKYCNVHDLLHELSIKKAKDEIGFESLISEDEGSSSSKPRHRVVRGIGKRLIMTDTPNQTKHLRSLFLHLEGPNDAYFTTWKGYELLRILDIEGSTFKRFPSTIRTLVGIRYLRLREVGMLMLPSWLDVLKSLEVLDLSDCQRLKLPDVTWKMDSLRHFYIHNDCTFPNSMRKSSWKNLETLKYIGFEYLVPGKFIHAINRGIRKLGITMSLSDWDFVFGMSLVNSVVQVLNLRWNYNDYPDYKEVSIPNSLDHLTKLKLKGPMNWCPAADKFPQNLTHLTLSQSLINKNDPMQELGKLQKLLYLKLDVTVLSENLVVSHDGFPRLKVLHLKSMYWLKNIEIEKGGMVEIQRLEIYECPNLLTGNLREHLRAGEIITNAD